MKSAYFEGQDQTPVLHMRRNVVLTGGKFYESLLGNAKTEEANKLAGRLIKFDASADTYKALVRHAIRAGQFGAAQDLIRRGKETLPEDQHAAIEEAGADLLRKKK